MAAPLHRLLWVVVAAALIPVATLSAVALSLFQRQQMDELSRATIETMRAMVSATDAELGNIVAVAEALAVSNSFDKRKLDAFHREAQRVADTHPQWVTITLSDPFGERLLDVRKPLGRELGSEVTSESFQRVLAQRAPVVGDVRLDNDGGTPGFAVRVPVMRQHAVRFVLTVVVSPAALLNVIHEQRIPNEGVVSIFDAQGHTVARSRGHDHFLGSPGSTTLQALMDGREEGWGETTTLEGQRVYSAFSRSAAWGWSVAVGLPPENVLGMQKQSFATLGAGFVLSIILGAIASLLMARLVTRPIAALRSAAQQVGKGGVPAVEPMAISEVQEVADALVGAARARSQAEQAREDLLGRERDARAAAEHASRSKDEFIAMLGHELRNPLAAIGNAIQLMVPADDARDCAHASRARGVIERQVDHLARLVDDLLDVARVVSGKIMLERETVNVAACIEHSVATLRAGGQLDKHDVRVKTEEAWVDADATRLEQVINNLLVNAVKYTPEGGTIELIATRRGDEVVVEITDTGVGIRADLLPKVFDLFAQGDRSIDRSQGGLGIGLTLVRRLMDLHGGSVSVASEGEGRGSRFTLRLPTVEPPAQPLPEQPKSSPDSHRVLVVEDNEDARDMLRLLLEVRGHHVDVAGDGPEGVERAIANTPEVAFVDLGLPGFDGFEVARRIREQEGGERGTLLVALSGYGSEQDKQRSQEAGFDMHLVKPVSRETLTRVLAELSAVGPRDEPRA